MSIYQETEEVEVRERRLHSVLSFHGTATELHEKSKKRELKCVGKYYSQCGNCANGCAETITYHIRDTAVISHAPIGCSGDAANHYIRARAVSIIRRQPIHKVQAISSNIEEKDTIYGASEKLRKAIYEANRRFRPKAIFIQASCASGIIGEDIESIAEEMQDELGYPIIPVYCEGFKSKIWSTGFDAGFHGILRKLVNPPTRKQEDLVNVFNFEGSDRFVPLLGKLNLRVNYLAPLSTIEQLQTMTEAVCSTHICETLATYITSALEEKYGVPEIKAPSPFGIDWTEKWLREIARVTKREELAEQLIQEERSRIKEELEQLRSRLRGVRVYVLSGDTFAHNIANIVKDLGLEIAGVTTLHHDQHTDSEKQVDTLQEILESTGGIKEYHICNKQPYQMIKLLRKIKPDLLIVRHNNLTALGTKLGIPTLFEGDANYSIGYDGVIKMGRRFIEALETKKVVVNIANHTTLPYTKWWLEQEGKLELGEGIE